MDRWRLRRLLKVLGAENFNVGLKIAFVSVLFRRVTGTAVAELQFFPTTCRDGNSAAEGA
jgi:hypothetical protein